MPPTRGRRGPPKLILDLPWRGSSRASGLYHGGAVVDFKGIPVKPFFPKTSKREKWHGPADHRSLPGL